MNNKAKLYLYFPHHDMAARLTKDGLTYYHHIPNTRTSKSLQAFVGGLSCVSSKDWLAQLEQSNGEFVITYLQFNRYLRWHEVPVNFQQYNQP